MTAKHNNYKGNNQNKNYQQGGQQQQHPNSPQHKKVLTPDEVKKAFVKPEEEGKIRGLVVTQQKLQAAITKSFNNLLGSRDGCMGVYLEQDKNIKDPNYKWKFKIVVGAHTPMFQSQNKKSSGKTNSMQAYLQNISRSSKVIISDEYVELVRYLEYYNPYDKRNKGNRDDNSKVLYVDATKKIGGRDYHVMTVDFFKVLALLLQVRYDAIKIHGVDTVPGEKKKKSKHRGVQTAFALVISDEDYNDEDDLEGTEVPEEVIENLVKTVSKDIVGVDYDNGEDDEDLFDGDEDDDFED